MFQKGGFLERFKPGQWAKIPSQVLMDRRLDLAHLRIYGAMAASVRYGFRTCHMGQRLIGRLVGLSPQTVGRRIKDLIDFGHVTSTEMANGKRGFYELTSPVFEVSRRANSPKSAKRRQIGQATTEQRRADLDEILAS